MRDLHLPPTPLLEDDYALRPTASRVRPKGQSKARGIPGRATSGRAGAPRIRYGGAEHRGGPTVCRVDTSARTAPQSKCRHQHREARLSGAPRVQYSCSWSHCARPFVTLWYRIVRWRRRRARHHGAPRMMKRRSFLDVYFSVQPSAPVSVGSHGTAGSRRDDRCCVRSAAQTSDDESLCQSLTFHGRPATHRPPCNAVRRRLGWFSEFQPGKWEQMVEAWSHLRD